MFADFCAEVAAVLVPLLLCLGEFFLDLLEVGILERGTTSLPSHYGHVSNARVTFSRKCYSVVIRIFCVSRSLLCYDLF